MLNRQKKVFLGNVFILVCLMLIVVIIVFNSKTVEKHSKFIQYTTELKTQRTYVNFLLKEVLFSEKNIYDTYALFTGSYGDLSIKIKKLLSHPILIQQKKENEKIEQSKAALKNLMIVDSKRIKQINIILNKLKKKYPNVPGPNNVKSKLLESKDPDLYKLKIQLENLPVSFGGAWDAIFNDLLDEVVVATHNKKITIEIVSFVLISFLILAVLLSARMFNQIYRELDDLSENLKKLVKSYGRFVPHEFLKFLNKSNIINVELGDQIEKKMTIFFSDIRDFTHLSEKLNPEENFKFINSYLRRMEPIIHKHLGVIDKYIGDAIMALFPEKPDDAVYCSIEMLKAVKLYNNHRENSEYDPIRIGIGVHTGSLMLGTIGGKNRMDGTVISDSVNLASRVESVTKKIGACFIITESTFNQMTKPLSVEQYRVVGRVKVRGKKNSLEMMEVLDGLPDEERTAKLSTKEKFTQALVHYCEFEIEDCISVLASLEEKYTRYDKAIKFYLDECNYLLSIEKPSGWAGVVEII